MLTSADIVTLGVILFIVVVLVGGVIMAIRERNVGKLTDALIRVLDDSKVRHEAERRYAQASLSVKDFIALAHSGAVVIGGMNLPLVDKVIDRATDFLEDVVEITDEEAAEDDYGYPADKSDPHTAPTDLLDHE